MARSYRKKMYKRNISNKNFLSLTNIPYAKDRATLIKYIKQHEMMLSFITDELKYSGVIIFDRNNHTWKGCDYDKALEDYKEFSEKTTGWMITKRKAFIESGANLLPPMKTKESSETEYDIHKDEVAQWIKTQDELIDFFIKVALINRVIIRIKDDSYIGRSNMQGL